MNRLTKKDKDHIGGYAPNRTYDTDWKAKAFKKLGQYEDIDEELGIKYFVLVNALKNGFVDNKNKYHHFSNLYFNREEIFDGHEKESFLLKDYGRTWALTREELL